MAFDQELAERLRIAVAGHKDVLEKKMFGGLAIMYRGKMAVGIVKEELMVRVVSEKMEANLALPHVRPMDFTGKAMKEMVFVEPEGFATEEQLQHWVELGFEHATRAAK